MVFASAFDNLFTAIISHKMTPKNLILAIITITLFQPQAHSFCIPCPKRGITVSSFTTCNCLLPKFHDETSDKCVVYSKCPVVSFKNPLPDLKTLVPFLHDVLSKLVKISNIPMLKDISLVIKASNERLQKVKKRIPEFLEDALQSILLENKELVETCRANMICVFREMMNRNNKDLLISKLKLVLGKVGKSYYGVFDDLEETLKKNCKEGECVLIRKILKWKEGMPERLEEFKDLQQIAAHFNKYFLDKFKKDLEEENKLH